jgi:hypothetical protein
LYTFIWRRRRTPLLGFCIVHVHSIARKDFKKMIRFDNSRIRKRRVVSAIACSLSNFPPERYNEGKLTESMDNILFSILEMPERHFLNNL